MVTGRKVAHAPRPCCIRFLGVCLTQDDGFHERALALRQEAEETIAAKNQVISSTSTD